MSMTPKQKANELFTAYLNVGMGNGWAKQCALIVVNEIIDVVFYAPACCMYWEEVKNEIEKV